MAADAIQHFCQWGTGGPCLQNAFLGSPHRSVRRCAHFLSFRPSIAVRSFSFLPGSYLIQQGPSGSCFNRRHSCEFLMSNLVQLSVGRFRSTAARAALNDLKGRRTRRFPEDSDGVASPPLKSSTLWLAHCTGRQFWPLNKGSAPHTIF